MNPRIRSRLAFAVSAMLIMMTLMAITGCNSGTSSDGGPELPYGHYFIQSAADDLYHFDQYFVIQPGNRFEFVEYGYALGQPANLCQVTRHAGSYKLGDSALAVTQTATGESIEGCHMTKERFQAYHFESLPASEQLKGSFSIRNVTANGFDGYDLFDGVTGWKTYALKADPYGFY